jgi:hypothetical protein
MGAHRLDRDAGVPMELSVAQGVLVRHALNLAGECVYCQRHGCRERDEAVTRFSIYWALPRRAPMASRPELLGARLSV